MGTMATLRTLVIAAGAVAATAAVPAAASAASIAVPGGRLALDVPRACVPVDGSLTATLTFTPTRRAGGHATRATSVSFTIDGAHAVTDRGAPFRRTLTIAGLQPQTLHQVRARATLTAPNGKILKKTVKAAFAICAAA
jgi:hypothetical protein